ncbi:MULTISPECIES: Uma2 family endonuclease [unclassified Moorena]|uniref:Uma2 family endonuclease n=1 Tax=unclassified Moorena TaxID=2683338 RepID=UPI0013C22B37|nr:MULTISPECIES: Uma2 family endonuclease [unclassified Moorena]NEP33374.1 Uma2 family endonuclease [Moorena sp. SIO3B2]NEP69821.1 Uma2 family endonuclease [Moorena sp. SIO3A5]NET69125.1 Uma2 family endonuclease [Moorena sp. SIO1G6]
MTTLTLDLQSINLTDEQFFQLCQDNDDFKFERNANGDLIIMSPTGGSTGNRNGRLNQQLFNWSDSDGTGIAFDSSTGFKLPNGADRSPDASWIPLQSWNSLTPQQQEKFLPLCPDFVIELRSPSDSLTAIRKKMEEYRDNGTRLGWLINRKDRQVEIYRPSKDVEVLESPSSLSGEEVLPGFVLYLELIW